MVEATPQSDQSRASPDTITSGVSTTIMTIVDALESDVDTLDIFEGEITGHMYIEDGDSYQAGIIAVDGIRVTQVETPEEPITPLARVEPDPGETVEDAVDSLSYAGD